MQVSSEELKVLLEQRGLSPWQVDAIHDYHASIDQGHERSTHDLTKFFAKLDPHLDLTRHTPSEFMNTHQSRFMQ